MKRAIFILMMVLLVIPIASAEEKHLKLLAVSETEQGYEGSSADLYLEIKPGSNHVFIDTFPLTKMDTQMSTRFAKSVACDFLDVNCEGYDFFYRIRADTTIIGGPSAGGALAAITVAAIKDIDLDEDIAITGTINSGGLIGSVGGLKEKIDAADDFGLKKVLIPKGERYVESSALVKISGNEAEITFGKENETIDLVEYGKSKGIEIVEVSNLNEVMYEFTGELIKENNRAIEIDKNYEEIMKGIAVDLCDRSEKLKVEDAPRKYKGAMEDALNMTANSKTSFENGEYYSAASFCFGANVKYSFLNLLKEDLTDREIEEKTALVEDEINSLEKEIDEKSQKTISDLQTYMIVKERVIEARDFINESRGLENIDDRLYSLAFAIERIKSAKSWTGFFGMPGKEFSFDKETLKNSCINKIAEAEERYQYVLLFIPSALEETSLEIDRAKQDQSNGDYGLCLFKASKAKAEADSILNAINANDEEKLKDMIEQKQEIVKESIAGEQEKEVFPILGYSYYEYARVLKDEDPYSALLYSEYALELSNLDIYFEGVALVVEKKKVSVDKTLIYVLIYGIVVGYILSIIFRKESHKKPLKSSTKTDYKTLGGFRRIPRGKKR